MMPICSALRPPESMSEITARIRSAGFWEVSIHPTSFRGTRIPNVADLLPTLQRCVVAVRGWDFPHIDRQVNPTVHLDFIEQESDWDQFIERWRFYQSGQFVILRGMHYDYRDRSGWVQPDAGWRKGSRLGIGEALWTLFEIFELAARLSNTAAGDDRMRVALTVGGLRGRMLVVDDPMRFGIPRAEHVAAIESLPLEYQCSRADLLANSADFAITAARDLFARFNWNIPDPRLSEWLQTLLKRA
jgi:hypothetical protein